MASSWDTKLTAIYIYDSFLSNWSSSSKFCVLRPLIWRRRLVNEERFDVTRFRSWRFSRQTSAWRHVSWSLLTWRWRALCKIVYTITNPGKGPWCSILLLHTTHVPSYTKHYTKVVVIQFLPKDTELNTVRRDVLPKSSPISTGSCPKIAKAVDT